MLPGNLELGRVFGGGEAYIIIEKAVQLESPGVCHLHHDVFLLLVAWLKRKTLSRNIRLRASPSLKD